VAQTPAAAASAERCMVSNVPHVTEKAADVVGLYLNSLQLVYSYV
jgi:hypothetical protein